MDTKINVVYLLPVNKKPVGGAKLVYEHSEIINKLNLNQISSQILNIKKSRTGKILNSLKKKLNILDRNKFGWNANDLTVDKNFIPSKKWIKNKISKKKDMNFNPNSDFLIIPEIMAHLAEDFCINKKIKYAIFTMGAYAMNSSSDYEKLKKCYYNAEFILTISDDTNECLAHIFPDLKKKIFKLILSINSSKIKIKRKKNLITYMPRKLASDSHILSFFLKQNLPNNWEILSLNNLNEEQLFKYLSISKIFLSFSDMEGFGLPPLEAALAGNKVIGYTGEGGKEYWKKPLFHEIPKGNILEFSEQVLKFVKKKDQYWYKKVNRYRQKLFTTFSRKNEIIYIKKMLKKINYSFSK
jgi:hypothetical protein